MITNPGEAPLAEALSPEGEHGRPEASNVEFGLDITQRKIVLGCPHDSPNPERNRYLIWVAHRHGAPVCQTLPDTIAASLSVVASG